MTSVKLIDFWAPWCGPCKVMAPIIEEIKKELGEKLEVEEINVDEDPKRSQEAGIRGIPTYIIMKDGEEVGRKVGITSKAEMLSLINS